MLQLFYDILISPVELFIEFIFSLFNRLLNGGSYGISIIGVSLAVSLLTLPLYKKADGLQEEERKKQKSMKKFVDLIKRSFRGDERFMILNAFYREQNYSQISALKGSLSLLLEIPFFIAAYHFLSHVEILNSQSFGVLKNLGSGDGLLKIAGKNFNLLPVLMTLINLISAAVYLKGFSRRDKIQTVALALIFLVLLYNSPSGLVLYWTCNNIFSLIKNVLSKIKNSRRIVDVFCAASGIFFVCFMFLKRIPDSPKKILFVAGFGCATFFPLIFSLLKKAKINFARKFSADEKFVLWCFCFSSALLVILLGVFIPSSVIASSPAEFVKVGDYKNPLFFIRYSFCYALGFFAVWGALVFYMTKKEFKKFMSFAFLFAATSFLATFIFFGGKSGNLNAFLRFDDGVDFSSAEKIKNLLMIAVIFALTMILFFCKKISGAKIAPIFLAVCTLCISVISLKNFRRTNFLLSDMDYIKREKSESSSSIKKIATLSRTGKNVLLIVLDRGLSSLVPYILEEKPELKDSFRGFVFYPNTISHGSCTNFGIPGLLGGYEYTPAEMNRRSKEKLKDKQNEADLLLPLIFSQNGFDVTVCDPPYANYKWASDISIFAPYPQIKAFVTEGKYTNKYTADFGLVAENFDSNRRNFFLYALMKSVPLAAQNLLYDNGNYFEAESGDKNLLGFLSGYSVLHYMKNFTRFTDENKNFVFELADNITTHNPTLLKIPEYVPAENFQTDYVSPFNEKLKLGNTNRLIHYQANVAAYLQLAEYFDFLRQNGCYDNTRIIIASDHGANSLKFFDDFIFKDFIVNVGNTNWPFDLQSVNALLLVKDFSADKEFSVCNDFMTNADVPSIALDGLVQNPLNPFTGKRISSDAKNERQIVTTSVNWSIGKQNKNSFDTRDGEWISVSGNIFDRASWKKEELPF